MLTSPTTYNQGELYWCNPDPEVTDTVGSEQRGDRIWVIISVPRCHRGRCVVGLPLSRHIEKSGGHLIQIPSDEITMVDGNPSIIRVALTDQLRALDKSRLRRKAGYISRRAIPSILDLGLDYLVGRKPITPPPTPQATPQISN